MYTCLTVIPFTGEMSASVYAGIHPPGQTPPWADTPGRHPLGQTPSWTDTTPLGRHPSPGKTPLPWVDTPPLSRHPPGQTQPLGRHPPADTPLADTPPADSHCSRRYSFYWNAFLLSLLLCPMRTSLILLPQDPVHYTLSYAMNISPMSHIPPLVPELLDILH